MVDPWEALQKEYYRLFTECQPTLKQSLGISLQRMVCLLRLPQKGLVQQCLVLDHAENEINGLRGGVTTVDGVRKHARIVLLAGAGEFLFHGKADGWR